LVSETSHPSVSLAISVNNHPERPHSMPSDLTARQASATSSMTVHTPSFSTFMLPAMAPSSQDASSADGLQDWVTSAVQNWESQPSTVSWPDILCHSEPDLGPSQDQRQPSELGELENLQVSSVACFYCCITSHWYIGSNFCLFGDASASALTTRYTRLELR
jgi:hypothetical protein